MEVRPKRSMSRVEIFPLLLIPVALYNLLSLISGSAPGGSTEPTLLASIRSEAIAMPMLSGARFSLDWGDLLLLLTIVLLLVEVIKSARTDSQSIINHMLSFGLFVLCLVEFMLLSSFASSAFFLITMIVLLDALAGMVVTIISARRDFEVGSMSGS
jgi:hypothetical protein